MLIRFAIVLCALATMIPPAGAATIVSAVYPADSATGVPLNTGIVVRFSAPLDAASVKIGTVTLSADSGPLGGLVNVSGSLKLSQDGLSAVFRPAAPLGEATSYVVQASGLTDAQGVPVSGVFSSRFLTGSARVTTQPALVATSPVQNQQDVPVNAPVMLQFSQRMNAAAFNDETLVLRDEFFAPVSCLLQVSGDGLTVSITPKAPLAVSRTFMIDVYGLRDIFDNWSGNVSIRFKTSFASSSTPPVVAGVSPINGDTGIPINAVIMVGFDKPINALTVRDGIQLRLNGETVPAGVAVSDGSLTVTLTPSAVLVPNTLYSVVVSPPIADTAGNPLTRAYTYTFTTGAGLDLSPFTLANSNPPQSATGVPTNIRPTLTFNKRVANPRVVRPDTLYLEASTYERISATFSFSADGKSVTLIPAAPLAGNTNYGLRLAANIADVTGRACDICYQTLYFTTAAGPDRIAPSVTAVSPQDSAADVPVNARVLIRFSEPVHAASVNAGTVRLLKGAVAVPGVFSLASGVVSFTPSQSLSTSTLYTLQIEGVIDWAGTAVSPFISTFLTAASSTADTAKPALVGLSPANGSTDVPLETPIVLTFSKPVSAVSVFEGCRITAGPSSVEVPGTFSINGSTVTFTPRDRLPGSLPITVTCAAVQDYSGNLAIVFSSSFSMVPVSDNIPLAVTSVTPEDRSTEVGAATKVVLTFSKALNPSTVGPNTFALFNGGERLYSQVERSGDSRTVTLSGQVLATAGTITVVATRDVTDLAGNHLADFRSQFGVVPRDSSTPAVVLQRPESGATGVPGSTPVVLAFSKPVDPASVAAALHVAENGVLVSGVSEVTDGGRALRFTPTRAFSAGASIRVYLDGTFTDVSGFRGASYQGQFTVAAPAPASLAVVASSPAPYASGVPLNVVVQILFNQDIESPANVSFSGGGWNAVLMASVRGRILEIKPPSHLRANSSFYVSVSARSVHGETLAFWLNFNTGDAIDVTPPAFPFVSPPDGVSGIGSNAPVAVLFAEPINPVSVTADSLRMLGPDGMQVSCSVTYSSDNRLLTLTPHALLTPSSAFTVVSDGIEDVAGNKAALQQFSFTSGTGLDLERPKMTAGTVPYNGTGVPVNAAVGFSFNKAMNVQSFRPEACSLKQSNGAVVPGGFSLTPDLRNAVFFPQALLPVGSSLSLWCPDLRDLSGNGVDQGVRHSFETAFYPDRLPPQVVGTNPVDGLGSVPVNVQVQALFSEPVQGVALSGVNLVSGGAIVPVARTLSVDGRVVTLIPSVLLAPGTSYTLSVAETRDLAGNMLSGTVLSTFTTEAGASLAAPTVSISPIANSGGIGTNAPVRLVFSERANVASVRENFQVALPIGRMIAASVTTSADGLTATLTPAQSLLPLTTYSVRCAGCTNLAGSPFSVNSTFTTGTGPDADPPRVIAVNPPDGASDIPVNAIPGIALSEALGTVSPNSVRLLQGTTPVPGSLYIGTSIVTFRPSASLAANTVYTLEVSGITDAVGLPLPRFSSSFTTGSATYNAGSFRVVSVSPASGAISVAVDDPIVLTFSQQVDPTLPGITVYAGNPVSGTYSVSGATVTFKPAGPLPGSTNVQIFVQYARNVAGQQMSPYRYSSSYTTAASEDNVAPALVSVSPANGATGQRTDSNVVLTFSKPLKSSTITSGTVALLNGSTRLLTGISTSADGRSFTLLPPWEGLPAGAVITVAVTHDVTDLAGNPLPELVSQFTTEAVSAKLMPQTVSMQPANWSSDVPARTSITLVFNKPMDAPSVLARLHVSENGALVEGAAQIAADGQSVTFQPSKAFALGAAVRVFLENSALDTFGNAASLYNGGFTITKTASTVNGRPRFTSHRPDR